MWAPAGRGLVADGDPACVRFPVSEPHGDGLGPADRDGDRSTDQLSDDRPDRDRQPGIHARCGVPPDDRRNATNQAQLVAVRVAHQPGFDRLVFEFGQSTAPGPFGMPAYTVDTATSLSGPSGQPVTIAGSALFGTRFQNASTQNPNGTPSYTGSNDIKPTTPLIKEVKIVEDFERVLLWGVGLDHLACPKVTELAGPFRVVVDFPTPP